MYNFENAYLQTRMKKLKLKDHLEIFSGILAPGDSNFFIEVSDSMTIQKSVHPKVCYIGLENAAWRENELVMQLSTLWAGKYGSLTKFNGHLTIDDEKVSYIISTLN